MVILSVLENEKHNCGFGTQGLSSRWIRYDSPEHPLIGNHSFRDQTHDNEIVYFAKISSDPAGTILWADIDPSHQSKDPDGRRYSLMITARINNISAGNPEDVVATVHIREVKYGSTPAQRPLRQTGILQPEASEECKVLESVDYFIRAKDFNGSDSYINLTAPTFRRYCSVNETKFTVEIKWNKKRDLYIDKICIYDQYYKDLFLSDLTTQTREIIGSQLNQYFGNLKSNPLYVHPYLDEPTPMMTRSVKQLSDIAEATLGQGKYVCGALGGIPTYWMKQNDLRRRQPYILYDYYPIKWGYDVSSDAVNGIQDAFNNLISQQLGQYDPGFSSSAGLKAAISWAQNFTPDDVADDVPFYHTMQVQAEHKLAGGEYVERIYRAPTPNEILAQGWLALCYGAKGLMYYTIMTNTPSESNGYETLAQYGLFESEGQPYDDATGINRHQDPRLKQVPNERYYAVQSLNQQIDRMSSELLKLTWRKAYSMHKDALAGEIISEIRTNIPGETKYVELGLFKKTDEFMNSNLDYFIIVNRRTLPAEGRTITVKINKAISSTYKNWKVIEIGTANSWFISPTGEFQAHFEPGCGKLFKLEPVVASGGSLFANETIPAGSNLYVQSSLNIPPNITLTISSGVNMNFKSGSALNVNGKLYVNGTSTAKVNLDFTDSKSGSGIKVYKGGFAGISFATILNAATGIYIQENYSNLWNTEIMNCQDGVALYNTNNYGNSSLFNCSIHHITYSGISLNNSSAKLVKNQISYAERGISSICGSLPSLGYSGSEGANWIHHCNTGLYVSAYSYPFLGQEGSSVAGGNNMFESNYIYHLNANYGMSYSSTSYIKAALNWWGSSSPDLTKIIPNDPSKVDYIPYLYTRPNIQYSTTVLLASQNQEAPNPGTAAQSSAENSNRLLSKKTPAIPDLLVEARMLIDEKKYKDAERMLKEIIRKDSGEFYSIHALNLYCLCSAESRNDSVKPFLSELYGRKDRKAVNAYAGILLSHFNKAEKLKSLDRIIKDYADEDISAYAMLMKVNCYLFEEGSIEKAGAEVQELKSKFPESEFALEAERLLKESQRLQKGIIRPESEEKTAEMPVCFGLEQNYPNPFNPSTVISYQLPLSCKVELTVFDILGREIEKLVEGYQDAGKYSLSFNGSDLTSGIYIYRLKAKSLDKGEVFERSGKMMLIK